MKRQLYAKRTMLSQLALIILTICTIKLFLIIDESEQMAYKNGIKCILLIVDFGVNIAIIVNNDFQGAILVFYVMRTVFLVGLGQMVFIIAFFVPIIAYYTYKALCFIQIQTFKVQITTHASVKSSSIEEQQKMQEQKRMINYSSLIVTMLAVVSYLTTISYNFMPAAIFISFLLTFAYEVYSSIRSEPVESKMISNAMVYNLYLYIVVVLSFSRMYYGLWFFHLGPLLTFLTFFFFIIRIYIGSYSDKFHSTDRYMFQITNIFKNKQDFKYLKTLNNEKMLRLLDNISREVSLIIYLLGFYHLISVGSYFFLLLGLFLINKFPCQTVPSFLVISNLNIIKEKGLNFHFYISFPLLTSILYVIFLTQNEQVQILFDLINQCSAFHQQFLVLMAIITTISLSIQFVKDNIQEIFINILQFSCPLMIFFCIYNIQCVNTNLLIILLYNLGLCFESIRNMRWNEQKTQKQY